MQKVLISHQLHSPFVSPIPHRVPGPSVSLLTHRVCVLVLPPWLTHLQAAPLATLCPGLPIPGGSRCAMVCDPLWNGSLWTVPLREGSEQAPVRGSCHSRCTLCLPCPAQGLVPGAPNWNNVTEDDIRARWQQNRVVS